MLYPEVILRRNSERLLIQGHPWVYSGAVAKAADVEAGEIVDILDFKSRFVARGYYNPKSTIAIRILTRDNNCSINRDFLNKTIAKSIQARRQNPELSTINAIRMVHGENDGLPGLIVDDYAGFLVVQFHTYGAEMMRENVINSLAEIVKPKGIYERSDVGTRRADGLKDRPTGHLFGEEPPELIEIDEGGTRLLVDVRRGQKTGFFLDQRNNRILLQQYVAQRSVFDCFGYTGGFSAHALTGGARDVITADISLNTSTLTRQNLNINANCAQNYRQIITDLFPMLEQLSERGPKFDVVVLDPPALVRRSRDVKHAMGVYTKLNRNAMKLVKDQGLLLTASCSTRISYEDFFQIVRRAAAGARVNCRILACNPHAPDHPINPAFPEGRYLKTIFAQIFR